MCGESQRKYFREGSIGQSKLSPRSSDIVADTLRSRVLYRLLFQGYHQAVNVISPSVPDNAGHLYDWVISDGSKRTVLSEMGFPSCVNRTEFAPHCDRGEVLH
jgi:hypothetical protein